MKPMRRVWRVTHPQYGTFMTTSIKRAMQRLLTWGAGAEIEEV